MTVKHITRDDVKRDLPAIIDQKGRDYVYKSPNGGSWCVNVFNGEGSCLIGRYLVSLGVPVEFLGAEDCMYSNIEHLNIIGLDAYLTMDTDALNALIKIQYDQDFGYSWGSCYDTEFGVELQ